MEQSIIRRGHKRPTRYLFLPNTKILPKGFAVNGLNKNRKTAMLLNGSDGRVFEGEWHEKRVWERATETSTSQRIPSPCNNNRFMSEGFDLRTRLLD